MDTLTHHGKFASFVTEHVTCGVLAKYDYKTLLRYWFSNVISYKLVTPSQVCNDTLLDHERSSIL
eukprot:6176555-Pleurochrysis_carterae.AAC.2